MNWFFLLQQSLCFEGSVEDVKNHRFFSRVILIHCLAGFEAGMRGLAFGCCIFLKIFGMLLSPQGWKINDMSFGSVDTSSCYLQV